MTEALFHGHPELLGNQYLLGTTLGQENPRRYTVSSFGTLDKRLPYRSFLNANVTEGQNKLNDGTNSVPTRVNRKQALYVAALHLPVVEALPTRGGPSSVRRHGVDAD